MKKNRISYCIVSIFLCVFSTKASFSQETKQNYFGKRFFTNVSGTYIFDKQNIYHRYNEYTLNVQASTQLMKSIFIGVETLSIFANGTSITPNNYFIKGGFLRYELMQKKKGIIFLSTSFLNGDYCTCGNLDPYQKNNIYYIGIEFGGNLYFAKSSFYINGALSIHKILNDIPLKYSYNIYKIGLGYSFGKKQKNS